MIIIYVRRIRRRRFFLRFVIVIYFFFIFYCFLIPSARVGHTTDMPRTKPSIRYCKHVAGRRFRMRGSISSADPSPTSLVINEKQLDRVLYKDNDNRRRRRRVHGCLIVVVNTTIWLFLSRATIDTPLSPSKMIYYYCRSRTFLVYI